MEEFKFGYHGIFTIHAGNEDQALRMLVDHLGQRPNVELMMGRQIPVERAYEMIGEIDSGNSIVSKTNDNQEDELEKFAKETDGEVIQINPGSHNTTNIFDLMKFNGVADDILFRRLREIDMEYTDFHISGYTSSLLAKERNEIWFELKIRGYKRGDIGC